MTQTTRTKAPLSPGERIAYRPRGEGSNIVITLQYVRANTYAVTTMAGPHRLDDWSMSYATEIEARSAARHVALAFREWGCETAITARRHAVEQRRYRALNSRAGWTRYVIEESGIELDGLMTLGDRAAYLSAVADAREIGG